MSLLVPVSKVPLAEHGGARVVAWRRAGTAVAAMLVMGALMALPAPVRSDVAGLRREADGLAEEIARAQDEEGELEAWQRRAGVRLEELRPRAERWLGATDALKLRNLLLKMARSLQLAVTRLDVEDVLPLGGSEEQEAVTVLGAPAGEPSDGEAPGPAAGTALRAERFTIMGRGKLTSVLLFAVALGEMPTPLRLVGLEGAWERDAYVFKVVADRLHLSAVPAGGEIRG